MNWPCIPVLLERTVVHCTLLVEVVGLHTEINTLLRAEISFKTSSKQNFKKFIDLNAYKCIQLKGLIP